MRRRPLIIIACFAFFIVAGIFIWSAARTSKPPFLTNAPAYETFLRATQRIEDRTSSPATNDLAAYVAANAPALQIAREAFRQKFEAPENAYGTSLSVGEVLVELASIKFLSYALKNEGRLYELQNKPLEAGRSYTDIIRFGTKIERGTFMLAMMGMSVEQFGLKPLQQLAPTLSVPARNEIAATLRDINSQRVPVHEIEERERFFRRRHSPTPLHYLFFSRQIRAKAARTRADCETAHEAIEKLAGKLESTPVEAQSGQSGR
jgi:hypothetical protein